ncbi:MAG: cytochrome B6 [Pirellulaceae bacterium]
MSDRHCMSRMATRFLGGVSALTLLGCGWVAAQEDAPKEPPTSYLPVVPHETFDQMRERMSEQKDRVIQRQKNLLEQRYDLSDNPAEDAQMSKGKPLQKGVRAKLPEGKSWADLAEMTPDEIKEQEAWPKGFLPLPHPFHEEGGMVFPKFHIDETIKQEDRDLTRFDTEFDLPDHFLPEFPPPMFLTSRPDLGDVSQGKLVTIDNHFDLFNGVLNPKQLEGLRLLVSPFMQQQFNQTHDRRSLKPHRGVTCFDCHANGHTNAATHLSPDMRPQENRLRIDTPTLRGVNIQRLFGSKRALKTVEDFTEFEQRAAYFDGDIVIATKKGVNVLDRASQVHAMGEFQAMLDFPPAPKLDVFGKLKKDKASESELRGEELFSGKARCAECHPGPYFTDNLMHDLKTERFHEELMANGRKASVVGPIKTFPLRGIKDSPPYLHDGRLLTLEDTVEFFNLVLETKLTEEEKADLVAYMRCL